MFNENDFDNYQRHSKPKTKPSPGGWAILDVGTETTDVSDLRNEFGNLFRYGDWDDADLLVTLRCSCGHETTVAGPQYETHFTVLQDDPLIVRCRDCEDEYRAKLIQEGEPRYPLIVKCTDRIAWVDSTASMQNIVRDDTEEINSYPCPECGKLLWDAHYHENSEAPEIGWEYYECPACDKRFRPKQVEDK